MQHYLRPDLLEDAGVAQINDWGATFTDNVERVELNSSGSRLRAVTRVGEFTNVGDLIGRTSVFTDAVTRDQVPAKLPVKDSGRNIDVTFTPALEVQDFIADLGSEVISVEFFTGMSCEPTEFESFRSVRDRDNTSPLFLPAFGKRGHDLVESTPSRRMDENDLGYESIESPPQIRQEATQAEQQTP